MFSEGEDKVGLLLVVIYMAFLIRGFLKREGREKVLFGVLSLLSLVLAYVAGEFAKGDHIGASLSGMVSIFMR